MGQNACHSIILVELPASLSLCLKTSYQFSKSPFIFTSRIVFEYILKNI
jgi:hypothetical protein